MLILSRLYFVLDIVPATCAVWGKFFIPWHHWRLMHYIHFTDLEKAKRFVWACRGGTMSVHPVAVTTIKDGKI